MELRYINKGPRASFFIVKNEAEVRVRRKICIE